MVEVGDEQREGETVCLPGEPIGLDGFVGQGDGYTVAAAFVKYLLAFGHRWPWRASFKFDGLVKSPKNEVFANCHPIISIGYIDEN